MNTTIIVPTCLDSVQAWLRDRQRRRGHERIVAGDGWYVISAGDYPRHELYDSEFFFDVTSNLNRLEDGQHTVYFSLRAPTKLLSVRLLRLERERTQLEIKTRHEWADAYVSDMMKDARATWPDARTIEEQRSLTAEAPVSQRDQELLALWNDGLTAAQIAERLPLSEQSVYNRLSKLRSRLGTERVPSRRPTIGKKIGKSVN